MAQSFLQPQNTGNLNNVTTIRVSGIPQRVTVTEFNGWFLFAPGYQQAKLGDSLMSNGLQQGWVRFHDAESAMASIEYLNGRQLPEDVAPEGVVLQVEWAKNDFKPQQKRPAWQGNMMQQGQGQWQGGGMQTNSPQVAMNQGLNAMPAPGISQGGGGGGAAVCTVFVGNLQPSVNEEEITTFCQSYLTGYERLKFVEAKNGKNGFAMVKFRSTGEAQAALELIPNYALASAPQHNLEAQVAKNDLDQPSSKGLAAMAAMGGNSMSGNGYGNWGGGGGGGQNQVLQGLQGGPMPGFGGGGPPGDPAVNAQNAPCDTLFIGNAPSAATEDQIIQELGLNPSHGFQRLQFIQPKGMIFILFDSVQSASHAAECLKGARLASFPDRLLTVQFAKNSLGKRTRM
eukprot:gnl/MRDRNA2_/MRDRNA2_42357_c0_seq2.p1 gnl/MRDRNA2_/MRDRNA2_42357_c0~~gnl/MRDRNA2_/MRDRNA2_42357_c0_seq2.p1  ORF type:complete len:418 (+),score=76.43 gnl/MRDRNA2_/MRDRNA2_42357_c0_seq2:59-1255(+)